MAAALTRPVATPDIASLPLEDRFGLRLEHEVADRDAQRLHQRLR
jgi:hypothetical protein